MNNYFFRKGFYKIKALSQDVRLVQNQELKVNKIFKKREEELAKKYLQAWKEFSSVQKRIKGILNKVNLKIDYFVIRKRFNKWRTTIHNQT